MPDAHKNFAYSTVATAPVSPTAGTTLVVAAGEGANFPATPFNATIWPASSQPTNANAEIVRVTNVATDTLTFTRTQESTSARSVIVGDQIAAAVTAKTLSDIETGYIANTLMTTTGDVIVASGASTPARLGVGATADQLGVTNGAPAWVKRRGYYKLQTGATAETFDRDQITSAFALTTAVLNLNAIELTAGYVVSNFIFRTGGAPMASGTNQWAALFDANRVQLAVSADQGLASMTASSTFTWPVATIASGASSTYTILSDGLYYVGIMIKATTMPNIVGKSIFGTQAAPSLCGTSNAAQAGVNAFPFTATAITVVNIYHHQELS